MMVIRRDRNWYLELDTLYVNEVEIENNRARFVRKILECREYYGNDKIFTGIIIVCIAVIIIKYNYFGFILYCIYQDLSIV